MTDLWTDELTGPAPDDQTVWTRPRDLEAERTVAASLMERPELIDELDGVIDPVDFSDPRYAQVWYAINELREDIQGTIAPHAVHKRLLKMRAEGRIPGVPFDLGELQMLYGEAMPASAGYYAEQVAQKAVASRLVDFGIRVQQAGMNAAFDENADLAALQAAFDNILRAGSETAGARKVGELVDDALERAVTPPDPGDRIPTGFADFDALTSGGLRPGRMVVVGARPGVGKTLFGTGLARAAAIKGGLPTLFKTLEMGDDEITDLIVAAESSVAQHHLASGKCDAADVRKLTNAREKIATAPLWIDATPGVSIPSLRNQVRTMVRTQGLRMVVVDYLQLMEAPRAESRQVAVAAMSRALKLMAKEFGIVVVVLCQLNRASLQRTDKTPTLADLRESGAIEQDADMVILLHRPDMYEAESPRAGEADLIVDKHRGGPRATITVAAQPHYSRFVDMAGVSWASPAATTSQEAAA
ncbi:replicative DNA helicase [Streptomyces sp. HPH0547]|uniref:replicative DNA helicase n=1 Tax=Streptomyces sp. HPH0547 TaxID=1203592 RepID=UPI00034E1B26|nr:replicative DNA helicase [Streptomyces sp. HPH0547]EPD94560.1 replicative DNA helicase [Streptomyces sp. HPH0547]